MRYGCVLSTLGCPPLRLVYGGLALYRSGNLLSAVTRNDFHGLWALTGERPLELPCGIPARGSIRIQELAQCMLSTNSENRNLTLQATNCPNFPHPDTNPACTTLLKSKPLSYPCIRCPINLHRVKCLHLHPRFAAAARQNVQTTPAALGLDPSAQPVNIENAVCSMHEKSDISPFEYSTPDQQTNRPEQTVLVQRCYSNPDRPLYAPPHRSYLICTWR